MVSMLLGLVDYSWYFVSPGTIGPKMAVMGQCFLLCGFALGSLKSGTSFWTLDS